MIKRRLAVLGAVGVLVLTALGGSAMADQTPSPTAGTKVTCTTGDGQVITFTPAVPLEGKAPSTRPAGILATRADDGTVKIEAIPEDQLPPKGESAPAVAASPGTAGFTAKGGGEPVGGVAKAEKGTVMKAEKGTVMKAEKGTVMKAEKGTVVKSGDGPSTDVATGDGVPADGKADTINCKAE
jgi:hypothetical protein